MKPHTVLFRFAWFARASLFILALGLLIASSVVAGEAAPGVDGTNAITFRVSARFLVNGKLVEKVYTQNGPTDGGPLIPGLRLVGGENRYLFGAEPHRIVQYDRELQKVQEITEFPSTLPELSWPMGAAYDSTRNRAVIVTLGGEGHLYSYSYTNKSWSLFSSMNNRDFESLVYHRHTDSFYGAEASHSSDGQNSDITITHLNERAQLFDTMQIRNVPFQLWGRDRSEMLQLDNMLLLFLEGDPTHNPSSPAAYRESRIYWVNPHNNTYQLVWRKLWDSTPENRPPTVELLSPPAGEVYNRTNSIVLLAKATDADGSVTSVRFRANDQIVGVGVRLGTTGTNASLYRALWTNGLPGVYSVSAEAFDDDGASGRSPARQVTIVGSSTNRPIRITRPGEGWVYTNINQLPIFAIVESPFLNPERVEFFADGVRLGLGLEVHSADLIAGRMFSYVWTNPPGGLRKLSARVSQGSLAAESPQIGVLLVRTEQRLPIVELLSPLSGQSFIPGTRIELLARAQDLDGQIKQVTFLSNGTVIGGGAKVGLDGTNASLYRLNWTNATPGTYYIAARATDDQGGTTLSRSNRIEVTPLILTNIVSITAPQSGAVFNNPSNIVLQAFVNERMPHPARVVFSANGHSLGLGVRISEPEPKGGAAYRLVWNDPPAGVYRIVARADQGLVITESKAIEIVVKSMPSTNKPPTVRIFAPSNGAAFSNRSVTVSANASDSDGTVRAVDFFADGDRLGAGVRITSSPTNDVYRFTWTNAVPGEHVLTAKAVDDDGAIGTSPGVPIVVAGSASQITRMTIVSPEHGSRFTNRQTIRLVALTEGGLPRSVQFYANGKPIGGGRPEVLATAQGMKWEYNWTTAFPGTNVIHAIATDISGESRSSEKVTIYVDPVAQPLLVVTRLLPDAYRPGITMLVQLNAQPSAAVTAYAVEDGPPGGWEVRNISHQGAYDPVTGKVKFGPFQDRQSRILSYSVMVPANAVNTYSFEGAGSANGVQVRVGGDFEVKPSEIQHPADASPADFKITINELTAYASAWNQNSQVPLSYVTRAGALWKAGEAYRFDPNISAAPMWWVPLSGGVRSFSVDTGSATRSLPAAVTAGAPITVKVQVQPDANTTTYALEEQLPQGWSVTSATDADIAKVDGNVLRWGPFYDNGPREISYTATPGEGADAPVFTGRISFDGVTEFTAGPVQPDPLALSAHPNAAGGVTLRYRKAAGVNVILETSSSLANGDWEPVASTAAGGSDEFVAEDAFASGQGFYRLRIE